MESKEIRSSVIARSMRFNGQQNQPKGSRFIPKWNSYSNSDFRVIPTKELSRVYLQKPNLLASKGIIDTQSIPSHRKFRKRYDQQNLKSELRNHTSVDPPLKSTENSPRYFTPLGFISGSHLGVRKKGKDLSCEKKSKEMKIVCDGTTFGQKKKKDGVVREVKPVLRVSTPKDRVASDVKFRDISSSGFISKDMDDGIVDCSNASLECQANSEEAHQPSPVSVLDPIFDEDMLDDDSEELSHVDYHSLEEQLETLKSESESYSDWSGMEVSSDEESVLDSEIKEIKDSEVPIGFLGTQQSRDSSYIDDILAEVVPVNKNWVPEKLDLLINPKMFEKLEKQYYTETYWERSERRILFDRVKSGLVEILESFSAIPTWKKPVFRRLGVPSTGALKQELCKILAKQEKQAKKESSAKLPVTDIDEWSEIEADDDSLVCELESMIVDELLAEVVSFM